MFRKKSHATDQLTVATLRKNVSNSVISKARIHTIALIGRVKKFYRDYRMPALASTTFLFILAALAVARQLEQTSLLALRNEVSGDGNGYSILLRNDEDDEFTRNDTTEDNPQQTNGTGSSPTNTTQSTSNSFTLENGGGTAPSTSGGGSSGGSTGGGGSSGGGSTETPPFSAAIDGFNQGGVSLQCTNPSKPNKGSCSKVYAFSAGVRTLNGPGSVNYAWQTDDVSGGSTGNFFVSQTNAITTVSREISIACNRVTSFSVQFAIVSPTFANSNTITVNHNCNEV